MSVLGNAPRARTIRRKAGTFKHHPLLVPSGTRVAARRNGAAQSLAEPETFF